jgi:hypothetical protein
MFSILREQRVCTSVCSTLNEYDNCIKFYFCYRLILVREKGNLGHQIECSLVKLILPTQLW